LVDVVVMRNGEYTGSAPGLPGRTPGQDALAFVGDLDIYDDVVLVVDAVLDYGTRPARFDLVAFSPEPVALPASGTVMVPSFGRTESGTPIGSFAYFDANAGEIVRLGLDASTSQGVTAGLYTAELDLLSVLCAPACTSHASTLHIARSGRYYLYLFDTTVPQPATLTLAVERTHTRPPALPLGTPLASA